MCIEAKDWGIRPKELVLGIRLNQVVGLGHQRISARHCLVVTKIFILSLLDDQLVS